MSIDFIDELERELRAASRRRVRLVLARLPRIPTGAVVLTVAVVISAAVAVPLLAVHSRSPISHRAAQAGGRHASSGPGDGRSIVVTCKTAVYGQLAPDWRSARAGTVIAGPIAWMSVLKFGPAAVVSSHFIEAIAVVNAGRGVTMSVPVSERRQLSLDYTSVAPRARFYMSQGASTVTLIPCARNQGLVGPDGRTQFIGGFIVAGPQCAEVDVQPVGSATRIRRFLPLGRSCTNRLARPNAAAHGQVTVRDVLATDAVGSVRFGASPAAVRAAVQSLLEQRGGPYARGGTCGLDHQIQWWDDRTANGLPLLTVYFRRSKLAGYQYGEYGTLTPPHLPTQGIALATTRGLRVGDTLARGRALYGSVFEISAAQGGDWSVRGANGRLGGFAWVPPGHSAVSPHNIVATIDAGDVGCPALSP